MQQERPADDAASPNAYPHGRGYGHDYMRGGEVFGGYGYSARDEYERRRGEIASTGAVPDSGQRRRSDDADGVS